MEKVEVGSPNTCINYVEQVGVSKRPPFPDMDDIFTPKPQSRHQHPNIKVTLEKSMYAANHVQLLQYSIYTPNICIENAMLATSYV